MANKIEVTQMLWNLANEVREVVYTENIPFSVTRLLFLKYIIDNNIGAKTMEQMQAYSRAQKLLAMRDVTNGLDVIIPVLRNVDQAFDLDLLLTCNATLDGYANDLFGKNSSRMKKGVNDDEFKHLMGYIGSIDLEEETDEHEIGKLLVQGIEAIMQPLSGKYGGERVSNPSLYRLAREILQVHANDRFCDIAAGIGLSTLAIAQDTDAMITNVEIDQATAAVCAMLHIMAGRKNFRVICGDSLTSSALKIRAEKMFVDGPIGARFTRSSDNNYSDGSAATLDKVVHHYLENDGTALVTVPSNTLFTQGRGVAALRTELVQLGFIHAVIALPPLWSGTIVNTNLLVIHKEPSSKVLFINAMELGQSTKNRNYMISDDVITRIVTTLQHPSDTEGFSCIATGHDVEQKDYNLVPATYVVKKATLETTTLAEIDAQLAELYRQLRQ